MTDFAVELVIAPRESIDTFLTNGAVAPNTFIVQPSGGLLTVEFAFHRASGESASAGAPPPRAFPVLNATGLSIAYDAVRDVYFIHSTGRDVSNIIGVLIFRGGAIASYSIISTAGAVIIPGGVKTALAALTLS